MARKAAAVNTADDSDKLKSEKRKALEQVLSQIERNFGKGAIMRLGDATQMRVETIPSGAITLDLALGGGYPKGLVSSSCSPQNLFL